MRRTLSIVVAGVLGLAVTGLVAPLLLIALSGRWADEWAVWATTGIVVALAVAAGWLGTARRRE